jgi:hypothetical protein
MGLALAYSFGSVVVMVVSIIVAVAYWYGFVKALFQFQLITPTLEATVLDVMENVDHDDRREIEDEIEDNSEPVFADETIGTGDGLRRIKRHRRQPFCSKLVVMCKNKFGRLEYSAPNKEVVRRFMYERMKDMKMREQHIMNALDLALIVFFIPTTGEIEAEQALQSYAAHMARQRLATNHFSSYRLQKGFGKLLLGDLSGFYKDVFSRERLARS